MSWCSPKGTWALGTRLDSYPHFSALGIFTNPPSLSSKTSDKSLFKFCSLRLEERKKEKITGL